MTDPRKADLRETDQQKTGTKKGRIFKAAGFCVLLFLLFLVSCWLFQPKWDNYYNYDTPRSFYQEPSDTIETLFLGTSTVTNGISPIELYKEYGLCAFVLGTPEQPLLASYFWLKEACRLHPNSLKNVVLETSQFGKKPKEVAYHWGIDYMPLSPLKAEAVKAYSDGSLSGLITGLCPVIMYHRRWKELDRTDSDKWNYKVRSYSRGHNFEIKGRYLGYRDCFIPPYYPALEDTEEAVLSRESLYYFRKIKELCDEKGLNLILMRAATSNWRADRHKAVEALAERSGIPYIDFNCSPIIDSIGFSFARDMKDGNHVNCYGMKKMTSWMGKYLTETCGAEDIRGQERYAFMEAEREEYDRIAGGLLALDSELDPAGYISRAKDLNYTVFLSVKDDAASDMTKEQREAFREMGLVGLSDLEFRSS